eukprot:403348775
MSFKNQPQSFEIQSSKEHLIDIDHHNEKGGFGILDNPYSQNSQRGSSGYNSAHNQQIQNKASDFQCLMVSIKLFFGLSYLSIPNTFALAGVLGGTLMLSIVVFLNVITMMQVLQVARQYHGVKSYSQLGNLVFGQRGKQVIDVCVIITQLSCCIAYQYFAASSINFILCQYSDYCYGNRLFMILLTIPVIFLSFLGSYKALSYLSIPSIIIAVMGMITIFFYSFEKIKMSEKPALEGVNWFYLPAVFGRMGIAMHIFSGNPSILNIRGEASHKKRYPSILKFAVLFLLVLFTFYGATSYIAYKEDTKPIFIMSMLPLDPFILFIFACFSFNSMTSYPVQILSAFQIIEGLDIFQSIQAPYHLKRYLTRTFIIISVTCVALIVPNFTDFLNISGSLGATFSCFVIPQFLYMKQFQRSLRLHQKIGCILLILVGISGSLFSINYTIQRIMHDVNN